MEEKILNAITEMSKQINGLSNQFENFREEVNTRFSNLEGRFDSLEGKVDNLEGRFDTLEGKVDNLEGRFDTLEGKVDALQIQTKENTEILKALQYSAEVNKAEHDKMTNDITHIKGNLESIKKDLIQVELVTSSNWNEITILKLQNSN